MAKSKVVKDSKRPSGHLTIAEATRSLGFRYQQYTRRLYLEGKLTGQRVSYKGYTKVYLSRASIDKYLSEKRRTTEGRRYLIYFDSELEPKVRAALDALEIEYKLELAYKGADDENED